MLSEAQVERYSRQIILPEVGARGQEELLSARIVVLQETPETSLLVPYLSAAGVGRVVVVTSAAMPIGKASIEASSQLNPDCQIETLHLPEPGSCGELIERTKPSLLVVDNAPDTISAAVNTAAVRSGTPWLWGRVAGDHACVVGFDPSTPSGCFECVRPQGSLPTAASTRLVGTAAAILATLEATEAIKFVLNDGQSAIFGRALLLDAASTTMTTRTIERDPLCATCGGGSRP